MAQPTGGMIMPKTSYAGQMIIEDHLKKCLAKTTNEPFKPYANKNLPRVNHSPFGDFPKESRPAKKSQITEVEPTAIHEQSIAAAGVCKYHLLIMRSYSQKG